MSRLYFSSALRAAVYWHTLQQSFPADHKIDVTEVTNPDFDLSVESHASKRKTFVRLIDPSISVDEQTSVSVKWASRTTKEDRVIFVLPGDKSAGQLAFQFVQLSLLARKAPVTALMVPHLDQVVPTLLTYATHQSNFFLPHKKDITSMELISHATTSTPLKGHEALAIRQLCGSVEGLEREIMKEYFHQRMVPLLDSVAIKSLIEFWQDEWII